MIKNIRHAKDGMDTLINHTRDAVVDVADRAEGAVDSVAGRLTDNVHAAGEQVRDGAETASRGAHRSVEGVAKSLDRKYSRARGDLVGAAAAVTDFVADNPGKILLLATSAGFALGLAISLRRRSS